MLLCHGLCQAQEQTARCNRSGVLLASRSESRECQVALVEQCEVARKPEGEFLSLSPPPLVSRSLWLSVSLSLCVSVSVLLARSPSLVLSFVPTLPTPFQRVSQPRSGPTVGVPQVGCGCDGSSGPCKGRVVLLPCKSSCISNKTGTFLPSRPLRGILNP